VTSPLSSERILAPHERPAEIVKLRQEQAGYDYEDGVHLFSNEALNMLLKFVYKSQVLAGVRPVFFCLLLLLNLLFFIAGASTIRNPRICRPLRAKSTHHSGHPPSTRRLDHFPQPFEKPYDRNSP